MTHASERPDMNLLSYIANEQIIRFPDTELVQNDLGNRLLVLERYEFILRRRKPNDYGLYVAITDKGVVQHVRNLTQQEEARDRDY